MELPITRGIYESLNDIHNDRIMRNIYTFSEKTKKDNYNQLLSYHVHRVTRKFIFEVGNKFSNLHGCGLFAYCSLLANSCSHFKKKYKTVFAWIKGSLKYYYKIFNVKSEKEVFSQLDKLKRAKLINYRIKDNEIIVFLLEGNVDVNKSYTRKEIVAQYAAIKTHSGYFFVNDINIEELRNNSKFYSEADAMVDLWLNTIYNDYNIPISENPVIYLDTNRKVNDENINVTTNQLSKRWGCSYGRVNKLLKKMVDNDLIDIFVLPNVGTIIFNKAYFKYFKSTSTYKKKVISIFKHFYIKSYINRYLIYLYKNKLNISKKKSFLEFVRFIKLVGFSPYKNKNKNKEKSLIFRINDLLSLFNFKSNISNALFKRVLGLFLKKVEGNYI